MIYKEYRKYIVECDTCGEILETGTDNFDDVLKILEDNEWQKIKTNGEWSHFCERCG